MSEVRGLGCERCGEESEADGWGEGSGGIRGGPRGAMAGFGRVRCGSPGAEGAWHGGRSEEGGPRRDIYREEAREGLGGGAGRGASRRGNRGAWGVSAEGSGVQKWGLPRSGLDTQTARRGARARRCCDGGRERGEGSERPRAALPGLRDRRSERDRE